ncbi:MAG: ABC transporter ATP-binding protein/permease [candidate division KSB1 bacterium]|nr:ABC transporter ATP-binding protein/permease [candidate division KSB1 bacterium]MDZ7273336.1 ABC transporter ATP-binding protein/permease [candidate division KSB1 bacterium]MDZ7287998.1 ABC transporter ATP-binding protein/permease [candidate division KSB1 bacterium]MDZ7300150.1 ABC transporter ATP-binding protein/permease [candidate division KSB1 bacterium]MDZ7308915.1 ABC transporter ATP-binding protein/permease [candidate division KSB1 bacterium]
MAVASTIKTSLSELRELAPLLPHLRKYRGRIALGVVFIFVTNIFALLGPKVLQRAIDMLRADLTSARLLRAAGLILLVSAAEGFFRYWMRQTIIVVSRFVEYDLRNDYLRHLQRMSRGFFNRHPTGDLMARATNDLNAVRAVLGPGIMYASNTLVVGMGAFILMMLMSVKLTLLAMLLLPLMVVIVKVTMDRIYTAYHQIQEQFSRITARVQENLSGIRVIKSYLREAFEIEQFGRLNREYMRQNIALSKVESLLWAGMGTLSGAGILLLLWVGGREVIYGRLSWGEFVAFVAYLGMLTWPMIALGWVINVVQQGAAAMGRINRILRETPEIRDTPDTDHTLTTIRGEIEFQNVSFRYHESAWALRHINLKIPAGMTLAIVGHTGSGKSTLVNLIPRLFDPTEGRVLIDGTDIRRIPLAVLRRHIGCVPQETFLFSDTIQENITFGSAVNNGESLQAAATLARIRDEIESFPERYATLLGERGINLSGGQKQRVAIARAILRQPRILILDDALSAVDTCTEDEILRGLRGVMRERTSIIISHRISTVRDADLIVVLKDGMIVERGTHELLLEKDGLYAELSRMQQWEEDLENL